MSRPAVFAERQFFLRQLWPVLLMPVFIVGLVTVAASASRHVKLPPAGPLAWLVLGGALLLFVGVLLLRLEVRLDAAGVHYRMRPLLWQWRHQPWSAVHRAYVRNYDPLGEYGGWGFKGTRRNRALNVGGGEGIQLELTDGTRLLLGTQRPAEARQALQQLGQEAPAA